VWSRKGTGKALKRSVSIKESCGKKKRIRRRTRIWAMPYREQKRGR